MYLYDLMDIKKKRVTHSGLTGSQVGQNCLSFKRIPSDRGKVNFFYSFLARKNMGFNKTLICKISFNFALLFGTAVEI